MAKAQIIVTSCSRRGLEIEQVRSFLHGNGYSLIGDDRKVDRDTHLTLLSACGFTQTAEDFGFGTLRRLQAAKSSDAQIIFRMQSSRFPRLALYAPGTLSPGP